MGLHPQNIGISMPHGFAGSYARQPDMVVNTRPAAADIPFGTPLKYDGKGGVTPMSAGDAAAAFVGVAAREIKSALSYLDQSAGAFAAGEAVGVFMRGAVNVKCQKGTPQLGGAVYVRVTANESYPTAAAGGFEAEADGANTVQLTGCQWAGTADADGVAELRILTMQSA